MTTTELEKWALEVFWPAYKDLCKTPFATQWTGGQRGETIKKILELKPSEDLRNRMLYSIAAQKKHRRALYDVCGSMAAYEAKIKYNKLYNNRDGRTWIFNKGWNDEIPSISEIKETHAPGAKCIHCGEEVHGPRFNVCTEHVSITPDGKLNSNCADELRDYYRRHPEIHKFGKKEAIQFIKSAMRTIVK